MATQPSFLVSYWPLLLAGGLILILPTVALLTALVADSEGKNLSIGKNLVRYAMVLALTLAWPAVIATIVGQIFQGKSQLGAGITAIVISAIVMVLGLYLNKNRYFSLGYLFGGLLTIVYTFINDLSSLLKVVAPVSFGVLLILFIFLSLIKIKILTADSVIRNWAYGLVIFLTSLLLAFTLPQAIFKTPAAATENLPEYPSCTPGQVDPNTNKYVENAECQKQLEDYYKKADEIDSQNQKQKSKAQTKQATTAAVLALAYIVLGYALIKKAAANYGLLISGIVVVVYTIISRTAVASDSVKAIVAILGILLVSSLAWRFIDRKE